MSHERRTDHPHDSLTEVGASMLSTFEAAALPNARAIVILSQDDKRGIALSGYTTENTDDTAQAAEDLIEHARAILRTIGMNLEVVHVPRGKGGVA